MIFSFAISLNNTNGLTKKNYTWESTLNTSISDYLHKEFRQNFQRQLYHFLYVDQSESKELENLFKKRKKNVSNSVEFIFKVSDLGGLNEIDLRSQAFYIILETENESIYKTQNNSLKRKMLRDSYFELLIKLVNLGSNILNRGSTNTKLYLLLS